MATKREKCNHGDTCTSDSCYGCTYGKVDRVVTVKERCEDAPCCGCCGGYEPDYYGGY